MGKFELSINKIINDYPQDNHTKFKLIAIIINTFSIQTKTVYISSRRLFHNQPNCYFRKLIFCRRAELLQTKTELIERGNRQVGVKLEIFLHDVSR